MMNFTEEHTAITTTDKDIQFGFHETGIFSKHEFLQVKPWAAFPVIIFLSVASFIGTLGNVLTLLAIARNKSVRNVESMFIVNLAISDLYVTTVADPISIIAKLEGEHFFDRIPRLCQVIAKLCTISCVTSLLTIAAMSLNRYLYVCHNHLYKKIFSKRTAIIICVSVYCVGLLLVLLNQAGIGDHGFDRKSLDCIWDRMATYPYTVVYSVTLVWIPSIVIGICYLRLYVYVRSHKKKMKNHTRTTTVGSGTGLLPKQKLQLAKTFILIYAVFVTCWFPYALLIVIDHRDAFVHEVHVYLTVWAHMHPSLNWLIYYFTQPKFAAAYRNLLNCGSNETTNNYPTPPSRENSDERRRDACNKLAALHEFMAQREMNGTNEVHCMEWKPIERSKSDVSLASANKLNVNNNGNGVYRKLYEEIRNIHSEGEVQIFVRDCSIKSDCLANIKTSHSEDLSGFRENDNAKYKGSGKKRRFALADGVQQLKDHSTAILDLIDKVCDSKAMVTTFAFSGDTGERCKACEDTYEEDSNTTAKLPVKANYFLDNKIGSIDDSSRSNEKLHDTTNENRCEGQDNPALSFETIDTTERCYKCQNVQEKTSTVEKNGDRDNRSQGPFKHPKCKLLEVNEKLWDENGTLGISGYSVAAGEEVQDFDLSGPSKDKINDDEYGYPCDKEITCVKDIRISELNSEPIGS